MPSPRQKPRPGLRARPTWIAVFGVSDDSLAFMEDLTWIMQAQQELEHVRTYLDDEAWCRVVRAHAERLKTGRPVV